MVNRGEVKDITSLSGFSNYTYSTKTVIDDASDFIRGDVDENGTVTINDATKLQRYLAEYITLGDSALRKADANNDGKVDIRDITAIQRKLAKIEELPA